MFQPFLSFAGAFLSVSLAVLAFLRDRYSFVHRVFVIGMLVLGMEAAFMGMGFLASSADEILKWHNLGAIGTAFLPGVWLAFSLGFARSEMKEAILKWRVALLLAFIIPLTLVLAFGKSFFRGEAFLSESFGLSIRLGWSGYLFTLFLLISSVLILMNLERIFRSSTGSMRWRIKFLVFGLGGLFSVRIYTASQAILFSTFTSTLSLFNTGALIIADILILISLIRSRVFNMNIYLSNTLLYQSLTIFMVGIYLIIVAILVKVIPHFKTVHHIPVEALFIFLSFMALTIFLMSEKMRQGMRRFINRHFQRPRYDYREKWREFNLRTTYLLDGKSYCSTVTKIVSETLSCSSLTIWLLDEFRERLLLGGSTLFSGEQVKLISLVNRNGKEFLSAIMDQQKVLDFDQPESERIRAFKENYGDVLQEAKIRYCAPLIVGKELIGIMTLNDRMKGEPFSIEDFELLKTFADQTAVHLLNLRLSENLKKLKEAEAYQTMSAFMMHDLKNLASSLSLTMQNLPAHFENLEFRKDALHVIQQSILKINRMCQHLSMLSRKIELKPTEVSLNDLVLSTLSSLNGGSHISILHDLRPLPKVRIDPEQIQKVLTNLILNAKEAIGDRGEIRVTTDPRDGSILLCIEDNGCGMSKEFMEESLFRPFKTTKKEGMGIGLFHSKLIVEAHQGRIEVESEEGRGTTFRVFLPLAGK